MAPSLVEHEETPRAASRAGPRASGPVVAAQPRELDVGPGPGPSSSAAGEGLDEVSRPRRPPGPSNRRPLARPGADSSSTRDLRRARGPRASARDQLKARLRRGIITSLMRMSGGSARAASSAACPSVTGGDLVARPQQPLQVLAPCPRCRPRAATRCRRGARRQHPGRVFRPRSFLRCRITRQPAHRLEQEYVWRRPARRARTRSRRPTFASGRCPRPNGILTVNVLPIRPSLAAVIVPPWQPDQLPGPGPARCRCPRWDRDGAFLDPGGNRSKQAGYLRRGDPPGRCRPPRSTACPSSSAQPDADRPPRS